MDKERNSREDGCVSKRRTREVEELRRPGDFRVFVPAAGKVQREAAGGGGDTRRAGRTIATGISGAWELLFERTGNRADLSECSRVNRLWENIFTAGQRIQ